MEKASSISVQKARPSGSLPACLRIVAVVAVLLKDADKLTMGQDLVVSVPHPLKSVVCQPPDPWLISARMTYYQTLLLNS